MAALLLALLVQDVDERVRTVVDLYRARTATLLGQYAGAKTKIDESLALAATLDEAVVQDLAGKLKSTPDEIRDAWKKRERKPRKASAGDGSWIALGGQDGGLDSAVKGTPRAEQDVVDRLLDRNPGVLTKRKPPAPPEPVPLGKPIKTRDEWWTSSSTSERAALLEAAYARKSKAVEKKEETKECPGCKGKGTVNVNRGGIGLTVVCARCHGAKDDLLVTYE